MVAYPQVVLLLSALSQQYFPSNEKRVIAMSIYSKAVSVAEHPAVVAEGAREGLLRVSFVSTAVLIHQTMIPFAMCDHPNVLSLLSTPRSYRKLPGKVHSQNIAPRRGLLAVMLSTTCWYTALQQIECSLPSIA